MPSDRDADAPPPVPPPPPAQAPPEVALRRPPSRLHPFSLVRGLEARAVLQAVPGVVILASAFGGLGSALAIVPIAVGLVVLRVLAYQRHTYEVTPEAVVERRGVLNRRERTLHLDRLQQVEVEQGMLDRLLGTAVVRLETASDAGASELELRVVAEAEARRLRATLLDRSQPANERPVGEELVHVPLAHVALAAVTGPRLLAIPVVLGGLVGILFDLDLVEESGDAVVDQVATLGTGAVAALVLGVLGLSVLVALALGVVRDGDFRIRRVGGDLHVRRGLLATREAVVPVSRVQLVAVHRSLVRRLLGFGSITLHSGGGGGGGDQASLERRLIVPLVHEEQLAALALRLLGVPGPWPSLAPHPPAAQARTVVRWWLRLVPWTAASFVAIAFAVPLTLPLVTLVIAVAGGLASALGFLEYAHLASGRNDRLVAARGGALSIIEVVSPVAKAQGSSIRSTPFQRRRALATLSVHVAGPGRAVQMPDLGYAACAEHQSALERLAGP